jgi:hypothetical protein
MHTIVGLRALGYTVSPRIVGLRRWEVILPLQAIFNARASSKAIAIAPRLNHTSIKTAEVVVSQGQSATVAGTRGYERG